MKSCIKKRMHWKKLVLLRIHQVYDSLLQEVIWDQQNTVGQVEVIDRQNMYDMARTVQIPLHWAQAVALLILIILGLKRGHLEWLYRIICHHLKMSPKCQISLNLVQDLPRSMNVQDVCASSRWKIHTFYTCNHVLNESWRDMIAFVFWKKTVSVTWLLTALLFKNPCLLSNVRSIFSRTFTCFNKLKQDIMEDICKALNIAVLTCYLKSYLQMFRTIEYAKGTSSDTFKKIFVVMLMWPFTVCRSSYCYLMWMCFLLTILLYNIPSLL